MTMEDWPSFEVRDRVRLAGHWEFPDGTIGTISEPDPFIVELSGPGEWQGHRRIHAGRDRMLTTYFVRFDTPTDDGSGDGPYSAGEIEEESMELYLD